jgi:NAD-dependent SIR2 family protein deacetylase
MPQIFHRSTNTLSRVSIFGSVFILAAFVTGLMMLVRSDYATGVGTNIAQPIPFSHKHHVGDDGIDCRYCHTTVETSAFAGMPAVQVCMNCHSQIWAQSDVLAPVRAAFNNNEPIQWNRVYVLPDFVYFDHSIHVQKGIGCTTCHGQIDQMPLTAKAASLQMEWCLNCHRNPAAYVRPRDQVFNVNYTPPLNQMALGQQLVQAYHIQIKTDCSVCHR